MPVIDPQRPARKHSLSNRSLLAVCICLAAIPMLGCQPVNNTAGKPSTPTGPETTSSQSSDNLVSKPSEATSVDAANQAIKFVEVDFAGLQSQVKQHAGKLIVLDVWSTACPPCMKEYHNLVALSQRWPDRLVCMSLNCDYIGVKSKPVSSYLPKVTQFLEKEKSHSVVNLVSTEADSDIFEKLEITSIPAILVYDQGGQLLKKFLEGNSGDDGLTYEGDVLPELTSLLDTAVQRQ